MSIPPIRVPRLVAKYGLYYPAAFYQAGNVPGRLDAAIAFERLSPDAIRDHQLDALRALVDHARRTVPFYRDRLADFDVATLSFDSLANLGFVTKEDLQLRADRLASTAPLGRLISKTSGGSTGQAVTVKKTRPALADELAAAWRGYGWAGIRMGDAQARFWGVPADDSSRRRAELVDLTCHRIRLSAFSFSDDDLRHYVDAVQRFRPQHYYGYVSMIDEFGAYVRRHGIELANTPEVIVTTSEVLTDPIRQRLTETFGARVFNEYGCGEVGTIAHECEAGSLHVSDDNVLLETVDDDGNLVSGEAGELVVTELHNRAMPLIRYRIGDFGTLAASTCACGRTLTVLSGVHGRAYDMIKARDGRSFHGEFVMYLFEDIKKKSQAIRQFQVRQEAVDRFRIRIVPDPAFGEDTKQLIRTRFTEAFDPDVQIEFEIVDAIAREKSGKMRLVVGLPADERSSREPT